MGKSRITRDLEALIARHQAPDGFGEYGVALAELRNVLKPGSARMFPGEFGHAPTCSVCLPEGDGGPTRAEQRKLDREAAGEADR